MDERCRAILDDLEVYLDRQCPSAGLEEAIRSHLAGCPPCMERADFQLALRALVAERCRDAAPTGLLDRVRSRLARMDDG